MLVVSYVISPIHLVATVAALRKLYGVGGFRCLIVFSYPGAPEETRAKVLAVIRAMCAKVAEISDIVEVTDEWVDSLVDRPADAITADVRARLGDAAVCDILYAHDVVGRLMQVLIASYPSARTICYGDALGMVYQADVHLGLIKPVTPAVPPADAGLQVPSVSAVSTLKGLTRRILKGAALRAPVQTAAACPPGSGARSLRPNMAALAVPIDQSGRFLEGVDLVVIDKALVLSALQDCARGATEFFNCARELLESSSGAERCLLLTENNAEAGFISLERESDMYALMVRQAVRPGATVIIKSHPGEWLPRNAAIQVRLSPEYRVLEVDPRFARYPIELADELVRQSVVVCMSFPTLSLKYLYDVDVINPMNDAFVENWFPGHLWESYKNAQALYRIPLARLPDWDGVSPLYSGG